MTLPAGVQTLTIDQDNAGWNIHYLSLAAASGSGSPLSASPSSESFGNQNVGSTSSAQTVTVTNPGASAVSMSSIGVTGPFGESNNCGTSLAAGASCTVSVTFAPTAAGAATGTLSVNSSAPGSPLTVALSGTGVSANTDLALNMPVTASSYTQVYIPSNAVDGNTSTYWEANNGAWPSTITVNLRSVQTLGSITVDLPPSTAWSTRTQTLSVLGSTNGTSFSHPGRLRHLHLEPLHRQHRHHPPPVRHQRPVRASSASPPTTSRTAPRPPRSSSTADRPTSGPGRATPPTMPGAVGNRQSAGPVRDD